MADQLTEASVVTGSSALKQFVYRYDKAANRTSEQIDSAVTAATPNNLNQTTTLSATGPIRFEGSINEAGTVSINGAPATVAADNSFKADVPLPPGSNTIAVVAKDTSNNIATKNYSVTVASGANRTLTYDLNGNMTDNGAGQAYGWDAANRLVSIMQASGVTGFVYDGLGRRVQETLNGTVIKQWVWCDGAQPCEERDAANNVTKRFYAGLGERLGAVNYYFTTDHLGSTREMTDSSGAIHARYEYDPYGRISKVSGDLESDFGFTGFYRHPVSGLNLTLYRAYYADFGRWLSKDPMGEEGGLNLYGYVTNNPLNFWDPLGLVDLSYTPNDSPENKTLIGWEKTQNDPGIITVAGHGTRSDGLLGPDGSPVPPDVLAKAIVNLKKFDPKKPIFLIVCYSGAGGKDSYAQKLANELARLTHAREIVIAPNVPIGPPKTGVGKAHLGNDSGEKNPSVQPFVAGPKSN